MKDKDLKDLMKSNFENNDNSKLEVDEKYEKFSRGLPRKLNTSINFSFKKVALAVMVILAFTILIPLLSNNNTNRNNGDNNNDNNDDRQNVSERIDVGDRYFSYMVYLAASKTLEEGSTKKYLRAPVRERVSSFETQFVENLRVSYPFDTIRIKDPFRFEIVVEEGSNSIIEQLVGSGNIEVIVSEIAFYEIDSNFPMVEELIIIFKGQLGVFSCLTNGGSFDHDNNVFVHEFSSHKFIEGTEIVKDINEDNITIAVTLHNDLPTEVNVENTFKYGHESYIPTVDSYRKVERTDDYEIESLFNAQIVELDTFIVSKNENHFEVSEIDGYNLSTIVVDEKTVVEDVDGNILNSSNIEVGQKVRITYLKYYDEYNPRLSLLEKVVVYFDRFDLTANFTDTNVEDNKIEINIDFINKYQADEILKIKSFKVIVKQYDNIIKTEDLVQFVTDDLGNEVIKLTNHELELQLLKDEFTGEVYPITINIEIIDNLDINYIY